MKPESKKKRNPINQEGDHYAFNLSSLKEVIEDCTEKKTSSKTNLLDLSSLSQALSSVKLKVNRKEMFLRRRRERALAKLMSKDPVKMQLFDFAKTDCGDLFKDLISHLNEPTRAYTEPQLCTLNQEIDILGFLD